MFKPKSDQTPKPSARSNELFFKPQPKLRDKNDPETERDSARQNINYSAEPLFFQPQPKPYFQTKQNPAPANFTPRADEKKPFHEASDKDLHLSEQDTGSAKQNPVQNTPQAEPPSDQSEPANEPAANYWTHDWQTDRFGNEALFIWEVGGKRRYSNANKGYAYIRAKAALSPQDTGYDGRFEKYKHRPQGSEGKNTKLNWWMKRTPGWDNPEHTDNGTADFTDLAEFKDTPNNKKGTGFYYMGFVFDPLIYEKLEAQKRGRENAQYIGIQTNYLAYVNAEAGIILHDTPTPDDKAYNIKRYRTNKADFVLEMNERVTVVAEANQENEGWVLIKNSIGEEGWIERNFISKKAKQKSDQNFDTYTVKKGDTLEGLITSNYKDYPTSTGNDRRTIALAIYLYNKNKPGSGVYRDFSIYKNAGSWKDTFDPWMQETRANYESIKLYAGGEVILPPVGYILKMVQVGLVEKRPDFANVMIESGRMGQGFIAGVGIGFYDAIIETADDLYNMIVDIFTGEIFNQIADMFKLFMDKGLSGIWEMIKEFGIGTWEEIKAAWNNSNPYERGEYFGKIIGAILFEVVLALITYGVGSVVRNLARVQKILKWFPNINRKKITSKGVDKYKHDIEKLNGDRELELDKGKKPDGDLKGPQKGNGTDSEINELAIKDRNQKIDDDIKDGEPDAGAKRAAMAQARIIVTAGDTANRHPAEIMSPLWALTVFKGVRGFSFDQFNATDFEVYMHGSKKRIKPKDGKYDVNTEQSGKITLTGNNWSFNRVKDVDWRGTGRTHLDGLEEAFKRTGYNQQDFQITKWGITKEGKTIPVEWQGPQGTQVNMDIPELNNVKQNGVLGEGPHQPHIGYQNSGKGAERIRGHIFIDIIPATR